MTTNIENLVREDLELGKDAYEALTFGDLKVGDRYIAFPRPGDNHGHGGYLGGHRIFEKATIERVSNATYKMVFQGELRNLYCTFSNNDLVIKLKEVM